MSRIQSLLASLCAVSCLCLGTLTATADEPDYDLTNTATKTRLSAICVGCQCERHGASRR